MEFARYNVAMDTYYDDNPSSSKLSRAILVSMIVFIFLFIGGVSFLLLSGTSSILKKTSLLSDDSGSTTPKKTVQKNLGVSDDDPSVGPVDARVTIVEFSDFQCPFCQRAHPVINQILARYKEDIRFIYRDFPVASIHPDAQRAAEAGGCAHEQGKFWKLHDLLFQNQDDLSEKSVSDLAVQAGVNAVLFNECMRSGKFTSEVLQDIQEGTRLGVLGTPTFFINGNIVPGALSYETFAELVEYELHLN